jgi:hypothetical protein
LKQSKSKGFDRPLHGSRQGTLSTSGVVDLDSLSSQIAMMNSTFKLMLRQMERSNDHLDAIKTRLGGTKPSE